MKKYLLPLPLLLLTSAATSQNTDNEFHTSPITLGACAQLAGELGLRDERYEGLLHAHAMFEFYWGDGSDEGQNRAFKWASNFGYGEALNGPVFRKAEEAYPDLADARVMMAKTLWKKRDCGTLLKPGSKK